MLKKQPKMSRSLSRGYILLLLTICLSIHPAWVKHAIAKADSLKHLLTTNISDANRVDVLNLLSEHTRDAHLDAKMDYAKQALSLATSNSYSNGMIAAQFNMGSCYEECHNDYKQATDWYKKAYELTIQTNNVEDQIKILNELASCYEKLAEYKDALAAYFKMLELTKDDDLKIQVLANSGTIFQNMGVYGNALENFQQAYNILFASMQSSDSTGEDDSLMLMGLQNNIANVYHKMNDFDRAISNYKAIEEMNKAIQYHGFEIWTSIGLGDSYFGKKLHRQAINYFNRAKDLLLSSESIGKSKYLAQVYNKLAEVYLDAGNMDAARTDINKSIEVASDNNNKSQLAISYITAGKLYLKSKDYKTASEYLNKSISICQEVEMADVLSMAWLELSELYKEIGKPKQALDAFQKHIIIRDSIYSRTKLQELTRIDMQGYFDRQQFTDSLARAEESAIQDFKLQRQRILSYSGLGIICLLLVLSYYIFKSYKREKHSNKIISEARDAIREEKKISENLLLNILPEEVAQELLEKGTTTATFYEDVTVMFTDFVNFTEAGERMTSQELVDELHTCFKAFDEIIDKYNIEKIKTIGDAYLAVSGLPVPDEDHATLMVQAANEIRDYMEQHRQEVGDRTFEVRVGLHSGEVVAGIVGVKKFAYDIWGDTVNTAARMEQNSAPGKVNISETTYELVKDSFSCTYRGELPAKNKGNMKMYFVDVEKV